IVENAPQAAAMALSAGTNLNCGSTYPELLESIEQGLTTESELDENLRQLLPTRFKLGLFDPPGAVPFDSIGAEWIRAEQHVNLSLEAAEKSIVLLKNQENTLPLDPATTNRIFVTGPTATHIQSLLANYYGVGEDLKTILEGVVANASDHTKIMYSQGAMLDETNRNPIDWFSGEAAAADVTIACVGISQLIEGEEGESIMSRYLGDREDIGLPPNQIEFLRKMRSNSKKLIVLITSGSAVACPKVYELADALLYAWYPGEQGGLAVSNVIFGKSSPSGRLPVTVPMSTDDLPPYEDYSMANRTYRYATKKPLFPFGFGLSYSSFSYSDLKLSKADMTADESVTVRVSVQNDGKYAAEEVVQLYVQDMEASVSVPLQSLRSFQRVVLPAGESTTVSFTIQTADLALIDLEGNAQLEAGDFLISVGGSSPGERSLELGASKMQEAVLRVKE
ncbi:MAG: glycoside hydrolase family 3 C-terminal domain-containing protein, partial [Bacteroidota bacterium]